MDLQGPSLSTWCWRWSASCICIIYVKDICHIQLHEGGITVSCFYLLLYPIFCLNSCRRNYPTLIQYINPAYIDLWENLTLALISPELQLYHTSKQPRHAAADGGTKTHDVWRQLCWNKAFQHGDGHWPTGSLELMIGQGYLLTWLSNHKKCGNLGQTDMYIFSVHMHPTSSNPHNIFFMQYLK